MSRILLVDDEPALLPLLRRFLEKQGYQVTTCHSAQEALAAFEEAPFDLVVTDLTLDGINGEQLIELLRAKQPALPAIIASGYPHQPQSPDVGFLLKPFLPQMLVDQVAACLKKKNS